MDWGRSCVMTCAQIGEESFELLFFYSFTFSGYTSVQQFSSSTKWFCQFFFYLESRRVWMQSHPLSLTAQLL